MAALTLAALLVQPARPAGAEPAVDLAALTRETQQQYQDESTLEIVWWLPVGIWTGVLGGSTARQQASDPFDAYLVFLVAEAELSPLGNVSFLDPKATRERFKLLDAEGKRYAPLAEDELPDDLRVLLGSMLPALTSSAGQVGESFRPLVFRSRDSEGRRIASPREPGELRVLLGDRSFRWRLPLAALLPPKRCPVDGEELSGAFRYCPYHGNELTTVDAGQ